MSGTIATVSRPIDQVVSHEIAICNKELSKYLYFKQNTGLQKISETRWHCQNIAYTIDTVLIKPMNKTIFTELFSDIA